MAAELYILSDRKLASIAEWQRAIDTEGFALQLDDETPFDAVDGFVPAQLNGLEAGFECNHWEAAKLMEFLADDVPDVAFSHPWKHALAFRWLGSNTNEGIAAYMAAAAYARVAGGIIFDGEQRKLIGPGDAKAIARGRERSAPENEEAARGAIDNLKS